MFCRHCGRQNIALRGRRDSGRVLVDERESEVSGSEVANEGNFRALLRLMADHEHYATRSPSKLKRVC